VSNDHTQDRQLAVVVPWIRQRMAKLNADIAALEVEDVEEDDADSKARWRLRHRLQVEWEMWERRLQQLNNPVGGVGGSLLGGSIAEVEEAKG
jgi:hypothetical protein